MKIKNYLLLIFTFLLTISFSVQAFADDNINSVNESVVKVSDVSSINDDNFESVCRIYFDDDSNTNLGNKPRTKLKTMSLNIPNYVETSVSFNSSSDFVIKTLNVGITRLVDVRYTIRIYNTNNVLAFIINNYDAGGVGIMKSIYDRFSYPTINIGHIELTVTTTNSSGSTRTSTGTAYR